MTGMVSSAESQRVFISDRCGSIFIFSTEDPKPVPLIHLANTLKSIRGMHLDSVKNYLFAIGFEEGEIAVYDIGKPGKVAVLSCSM